MEPTPDQTWHWGFGNFFASSNVPNQTVLHLLAFTVAAFVAGLVSPVMLSGQIAPRARLASSVSAVAIASATLRIADLALSGRKASPSLVRWVRADDAVVSNGHQDLTCSIDVPMLTAQLPAVMEITKAIHRSNWWRLAIAELMVAWLHICWALYGLVRDAKGSMPERAGAELGRRDWLLVAAWALCPVAIGSPRRRLDR